MLRVKTTIKESSIKGAGLGLFANEDIKKGTIIWQYDEHFDQKYTKQELFTLHNLNISYFLKYCYREGDTYIFCCDDAKYFNHSFEPNVSDDISEFTIANRDIKSGEELLCNYTQFCDDAKNGIIF